MSAATDACTRLRAERDELRAKVRAVEEACDEAERVGWRIPVATIRAALDGS